MARKISYQNINKTPYLTWNWLKMNRGVLETEIDDKIVPCASIRGTNDGLEVYKDDGSGCSQIAALEKSLPFMAQSSSTDITDIVSSLRSIRFALVAKKECLEPVVIDFNLKDGQSYSGVQTIIGEENSSLAVIMNYTSLPFDRGFCAIQTKVWAKPFSRIHIIKVQLLGQKYIHLDDLQTYADEGAEIKVTQIELGAEKTFANVTAQLAGFKSSFTSSTAYIAKNEQELDMNYCVVHTGTQTNSKMSVKGSVAGNAKKLHRGTIDFKRGCKGSKGNEQEEALLVSPTAVNRSIPMILCGEEEVEGAHGGTLGHLGEDELFYFQSRGIDQETAKAIMVQARIMETLQEIPDKETADKIKSFLGESEQ